jgi:hypothetical protein
MTPPRALCMHRPMPLLVECSASGRHPPPLKTSHSEGGEASNRASLTVSLGKPLASFVVDISVKLLVLPDRLSSALTSLKEELRGGSTLTSWLLRDASNALKTGLQASACQRTVAIDALDVDIRRSGEAVILKPSQGFLEVCFPVKTGK